MLSDLPLRGRADPVTDPSNPIATELQRVLVGHFGAELRGVGIFITSYSYLPGAPRDARVVFDVLVSRRPRPCRGAAIADKAGPRDGRAYRPAPAS
jgi:RNase adaptor protein for sRNA GlmZ degradation